MKNQSGNRGAALFIVMMLLMVMLPLVTVLLTTTSLDLKLSSIGRRQKTANALANNVVTELMRQFEQNYQSDHYGAANINRVPVFYNLGYSSITIIPNTLRHTLAFQAVGTYGPDINNPMNKKTINGIIKFISDLTTFGTMVNGAFTTSASNVTYQGKVWINGAWTITGTSIVVNGGPVFVNGTISTAGGDITINGDLYRAGGRAGAVTVNNGTDHPFMPQLTWPTIDKTYFDNYANVTVTANSVVRFQYDGVSSTGSVLVGTTYYAIPASGFIIYGQNCDLTSSGTVKGHVTVASIRVSGAVGGNLIVDDNLSYATVGSTNLANASDSFAGLASNSIAWNKNFDADLYFSGSYFVDSPGTGGMSTNCPACGANRTFRLFGTRNKGITVLGGWSASQISFDTNLDTYPPPGLPEKPYLVNYRVKNY